jgi:glyoxylase-like metal-dependent hydrolase (beta-lactamase superfamily II)
MLEMSSKVAEDTYIIDPEVFDIKNFTCVYVLASDSLTLVDSGSPKSVPLILNGLKSLGFTPEDVTRIIISHLHFDHASGAGELLSYMPQAKVYVHPAGYDHLVDPSRLIKSAKKVFGKMIDIWYGGFAPVDKNKIVPVDEGDIIDLGNSRQLKVYATPGHAKHGICLYDTFLDGLFTGDETGVYIPDSRSVIPTTPPPDFDPEVNMESIKRLRAINPGMLLFSHYKTTKNVDKFFAKSMELLSRWKKIVKNGIDNNLDFEKIVTILRTDTEAELGPKRNNQKAISWLMEYHIPMCAKGYLHYFAKSNPPALNPHL